MFHEQPHGIEREAHRITTMDLSRRIKSKEGIVIKEDEEGAYLFDPSTGNLKYMNLCAKETFALLDGRKELKLIVDHLVNLYPSVAPERIREDVDQFLKELEQNGFVS